VSGLDTRATGSDRGKLQDCVGLGPALPLWGSSGRPAWAELRTHLAGKEKEVRIDALRVREGLRLQGGGIGGLESVS
jgi:hypothetical protein